MTQQLGLFPETQADRVLQMLRESELGVCGTEFTNAYVPRYSARLKELRDAGHRIENRKCHALSHHHRTKQTRYVLIAPRQHRLSPSE